MLHRSKAAVKYLLYSRHERMPCPLFAMLDRIEDVAYADGLALKPSELLDIFSLNHFRDCLVPRFMSDRKAAACILSKRDAIPLFILFLWLLCTKEFNSKPCKFYFCPYYKLPSSISTVCFSSFPL